jgi:hypothetical protein
VAFETASAAPPAVANRWPFGAMAKWLFGIALMLDVGVLLFVLSLANATAEGPAKRSLAYSVAIITEVDAYLDAQYQPLRDAAAASDEPVTLPGAPIAATFTAEQVRTTTRDEFRALLLRRWASALYDDGTPVLHQDRGADISFFSTQGLVRSGMDFLRPTPHRVLGILTIVFAVIAAVLAAGLAATTRGYGRLFALGLSVLLGALPFLILAVAVRFALRVAADGADDYFVSEYLRLAQELTWAPIRNGLIFSVGAGVVLVAGLALARRSDARPGIST